MKDNYISPEFRESMTNWAQGLIQRENQIRGLKSKLDNIESAIDWCQNEINRLENDPSRKQHTKHKAELKHQIRRYEIEFAFSKADWDAIPASIKSFYFR